MRRSRSGSGRFALCLLLCTIGFASGIPVVAAPVAGSGARIASIPSRAGVTIPVLLADAASPSAVFVIFPGGSGVGHFRAVGGRLIVSNNFLLRVFPLLVEAGIGVVVVGPPTDHATGMSDVFRMSPEHAQDVAAILDSPMVRSGVPRFLVGTSRGTLSVAALAAGALGKGAISGAALTASIGVAVNPPPNHLTIKDAALANVNVPVLFLHHREDRCVATPYGEASRIARALSATTKTTWVQAIGGAPPIARPCEAMSQHGFLGLEKPAATAMVQWATGQAVPEVIGP